MEEVAREVELFFEKNYLEGVRKYKNLEEIDKKKRSLEEATKNAYESYIRENGRVAKEVFIDGFHRFYDRVEAEIKEDEEKYREKELIKGSIQKLNYDIYKDKKEYLKPIKRYLAVLVVFNILLFGGLGYFVVEKYILKEREQKKVEVILGEKLFLEGEKAQGQRNYKVASKKYREAAKKGHGQASYNLGTLYFKGYYVDKNYEKAYSYWKEAADRNIKEAYYSIGIAYLKGYGVNRDVELAKRNFEIARVKGMLDANYSLGNLYYLEKDYRRARIIWEEAYEQGHKESGRSLANLYMSGIGVKKDVEKAMKIREEAN